MWKSRGNLQGYQFNAVIGHWKPFAYNLINDPNSKIIKAEGFVLDVMNYLKKHLNFTLNLTFKERWTDIVEMVHKKQVDLAATGFSQTFKRSSLVDFSFPLTSISLRFVYTQSKMMWPEFPSLYLGQKIGIFLPLSYILFQICAKNIRKQRYIS